MGGEVAEADAGTRVPRIAIVEDEFLVALDIDRSLAGLPVEVLEPVGSVVEAEALFDVVRPDFVILDVNLNGAYSEPLAERLSADGIPFAVLTGYPRLPEGCVALARAPKIVKPFRRTQLLEFVAGRLRLGRT